MLYSRFLLFPLVLAAITALAESKPIELVLSSKTIEPTTSLELRFVEPMVGREEVGQAAKSSPLVLQPTLKGKFVWLSTRSGAFTPEEPWPLSTTFQLTLRNDLINAEGKPCKLQFHETLQTPALELKGWHSRQYIDSNNAPAAPRVALLFNADIAFAEAEKFTQFVADGGATIAARLREPKEGAEPEEAFPVWRIRDHSVLTWAERFYGSAQPQSPRGNQITIAPAQPLTAGMKWKLVVLAGLPGREEHVRLLSPVEIPIGAVQAFTVEASMATSRQSGRRIMLTFSKVLGGDVNANNVGRWIRVTPEPANMHAQVEGSRIELAGDFDLATRYRVSVAAGFPSGEPLVLSRAYSRDLTFKPMASTLAFEEFSTHQLSAGERRFHLLAINVPRIRVTAKLFTAEVLPLAVAAYDRASGRKLPPENLAGRTIWQQEIKGTSKIDGEEEIALAWDEILGAHKAGAVLLTAEETEPAAKGGRPIGTQALVQLTDLGVVWKSAKGEIFVHVFSLTTQEALNGVQLRALDEKQALLAEATTDSSGIARLSCASPHRLLAVRGADSHLVDLTDWQSHISVNRLRVRYSDEEGDEESGEAFIFTDRGVYKPGDTAHLKAIVRDRRASGIPTGGKARLRVSDPREREIVNKIVMISDNGSCSEDIALPAGKVGTYRVVLEFTDAEHRGESLGTHAFEVQEYRPNPFEVLIGGARSGVGARKFELPVSAKYYMGKPLSKAKVNWSLTADDQGFAPEGFDGFDFCHAVRDGRLNRELDRLGHFNDQGEDELDERGTTAITAFVPLNDKAPQPRSGRLLCEITDLDQQTVSESARFTVHSSDFYLGVRRLPEVVREGEPLAVDLIAVGSDGTPCADTVAATVRLTRIDWQTNRVETAGESTEYTSEPRFELIAQSLLKTRSITKQNNRWVMETGAETQPLRAGQPGQYLFEAVARDKEGRDVVTTATFYVSGESQSAWDYRNPFQIDLVANKDAYRCGETATLLVKTPIDGEALVTVERETVLRSFITRLSGTAPSIAIPIEEGDAPNVFVSIILLRGAAQSPRKVKAPEYRVGYCELKVERPEARLSVYVKPTAPSCQPGDQVVVNCEVLDFEGRAVADSELTLYAVDEGVLSLTGYQTPDPLAFFQKPRPLGVQTALTLPTLLDEDPDARDFVNKGYLVGGGGEPGAERIRKNFIACAFWNATLHTDELGRVSATFTAPDSLTRYRVIAVVQTHRDQFGSGEATFEVNKPVMIEPALPRFANVGDKLVLRAVLHNTTDLDGQVEVAVALDDTAKAAKSMSQVSLAAHGSVAVDFPVEMVKTGHAHWRWSAHFLAADAKTAFRDVVQTELKVNFPAPLLREVRVCQMDAGKVRSVDGIDPRLLEGNGIVRVSITNSRAIELQETLRQLLHYPYGCVEQTTSSTLPWLGLDRVRGALPALQCTDSEIAGAIQHGVDRLLSMQTSSGGLAYWPGEPEPMFWGSAYGGMGLVLAKRRGADVPAEELDRLLKYISEQLRGTGEKHDHYGLAPSCLALYTLALAGRAEPAYHELLFKKRELLSDENRALLALAIQESKGPAGMVEQLLASGGVSPRSDVWFSCQSRQVAMRLLAWCRQNAAAPAVEALAAELLGGRRIGHWSTTQGNAWSLLAMAEYFERVEGATLAGGGEIEWGRTHKPFVLENRAQVFTTTLPIEAESATQPLQLSNNGSGRIFAEVEVEAQPASLEQAKQDAGYAIERTYARIEENGQLTDLGDARVGDRVLVTLSIEVRRDAEYLAIDDPLPAIFEPLNPVFKTQETRAQAALTRDWVSDHKELREDRALFFADSIAAGRYTLRYLARVCAAGTATAPAAKVEEMYHPDRFGLSGSAKVSSRALE